MPALASISGVFRQGRALHLLANLGWQTGARALNLLVGVVAGGLVARHLTDGLSQYREAQFYVSLATPLTVIISNNVVMRRLVGSEDEGRVLGTAATLIGLCGAFFFSFITVLSLWLAEGWEQRLLYIISALSLLAWWPVPCGHALEAHLHGRESALANSAGSLAMRGWEIVCAAAGAGMAWFCASVPVATAVTMLMLALFYRRLRGSLDLRWRWDSRVAAGLLRESWPLVLGGVAGAALFRLNLVLLRHWAGDAEASYYSAALDLPLSAQLVAGIMLTVFFPGLTHLLTHDPALAWRRLEQFTRACAALGLAAAVLLSLGAPLWTRIIYGPAFAPTATVMSVVAWMLPAMFLAQGRGAWLLHSRRTVIELGYLLGGIGVDVMLAWLLVPRHGAVGAAWALVGAYAFTWVLSSFLHPETRRFGGMQLRALCWPIPSLRDLHRAA
jgi:O-antigen/teichoic acid export membrane protein